MVGIQKDTQNLPEESGNGHIESHKVHQLYLMIGQKKHIPFLLLFFFINGCLLFSQSYTSKDNYTGAWETPASWIPLWAAPLTNINGINITINGYITLNGSLSLKGTANKLTVNDTLVIKGNFLLDNNNDLAINDNGVLIILGDLTLNNQTTVVANGYLIVTGNFKKNSAQGSLLSNDNPVKVFINGTITPVNITADNVLFPALNCTGPATTRYPDSNCSYGNMIDLISDPLYLFFKTVCTTPRPVIKASGQTTFCEGESITLTSDAGSTYIWSTGATTQSISVTATGNYSVKITDTSGCLSAPSIVTDAVVIKPPDANAGPDQVLEFAFETLMNAQLSAGETGEWSVVKGSGQLDDLFSPASRVTGLSFGENIFLWKVSNSICETSANVIITVKDPVIPSVITPDGDGKNDYFRINENSGKVELIIFNRWGNEEFSSDNYLNSWDGRNNKGAELPADTYFYVIKYENNRIMRGSVLIKR